uniref:Glutathione S-transferase n=1 Tax=Caligus rogercresseyi TaxID=217165 RepID=C1BP72_CALRO|nr:Glutathione S-transferase P [Caligus rogercresseyi]
MSLTLTYFPVRGRAEVIRVMLKDQGAEFDEKVITMEMWKEGTLKASCLFGQLPIFQDGDLTLYQTNAIRRHLARKLGLYGKDQREAALIDMVDEAIQDLLNKYIKLMFEKDDSGKERYLKALPTDLKPFEKTLSSNKGSFLVGDKISLADYALVLLLVHHQVLSPPCLDAFPSLQSYLKRLCARPNLHAYLHSDDFKNRPIIPGNRA